MYTNANDRRWWSAFTLVAVAVAVVLAILACSLLWMMWHSPSPVAPPTRTPSATASAATASVAKSTTAQAEPTKHLVPEPAKKPNAPPAQPTPTLPSANIITVLQPTLPVTDVMTVLHTGSDLEVESIDSDLEVERVEWNSTELLIVHVRNNGPASLVGETIGARCLGATFLRSIQPPMPGPAVDATGGGQAVDAPVGSTIYIDVAAHIDPHQYSYPIIQCYLSLAGNFDPDPNNNVGGISLP